MNALLIIIIVFIIGMAIFATLYYLGYLFFRGVERVETWRARRRGELDPKQTIEEFQAEHSWRKRTIIERK